MGWDVEHNPLAPDGLEVAVQELKDSIGASEKKIKKVFYKDYMDYYGFSVSMQTPFERRSNEQRFHYELTEKFLKEELYHAQEREGKNNSYSKEAVENIRKRLEWIETFQEFFKIPVLENEACMISMEKDENGNLIGWGMSGQGMGAGYA